MTDTQMRSGLQHAIACTPQLPRQIATTSAVAPPPESLVIRPVTPLPVEARNGNACRKPTSRVPGLVKAKPVPRSASPGAPLWVCMPRKNWGHWRAK
jgi:hypothetical protein